MAEIILDMGSGNTCQNDDERVRRMIDAVDAVDTGKHHVILKWQLFKSAPPNIPLAPEVFDFAYRYADGLGYETTASVFDLMSLDFLSDYSVPFVKIACRPDLYFLYEYIQPGISVYTSTDRRERKDVPGNKILSCIRKYPAKVDDYVRGFEMGQLMYISDHTVGWGLFNEWNPLIIEKHFTIDRDPENPDAGPFAVMPEQLMEVL